MFDIYSLKGLLTFTEPLQRNPVSFKVLQHTATQFPLNYTSMAHVTHFDANMRNTHTHTVYLWKIPFSFQPRSTFDTGTEELVEINGAFLSCGGEPHPHGVTRTHSEGSPLKHSHARALCKCQTVGERVYLGAVWYFYTFLIASYVGRTHRNTLTHKRSLFQHFPVQLTFSWLRDLPA